MLTVTSPKTPENITKPNMSKPKPIILNGRPDFTVIAFSLFFHHVLSNETKKEGNEELYADFLDFLSINQNPRISKGIDSQTKCVYVTLRKPIA